MRLTDLPIDTIMPIRAIQTRPTRILIKVIENSKCVYFTKFISRHELCRRREHNSQLAHDDW